MNSEQVIRVVKLGKRYALQQRRRPEGLRHAIHDGAASLLRNLRLALGSKRSHTQQSPASGQVSNTSQADFWALDDVTFEMRRGEVIGIIGRNGAGKSTLLKILSRITEPSVGRIEIDGRIASLLEVGTGFHPELTGRENIYLNGAILGMTRREVCRKFDEIVDFAGVEKFLDLAVKRYSSGMYVRLAFAIAAHLEPDVLIVDEVLAVGDAAFQRKCLGKLEQVSSSGRSVLFVSHDLGAVSNLCSRALLLEQGKLVFDGRTSDTLQRYQVSTVENSLVALSSRRDRQGEGEVRFTSIELLAGDGRAASVFLSGEKIRVRLHYEAVQRRALRNCRVSVSSHAFGKAYFVASTELISDAMLELPPVGAIDCVVDELPLSLGVYQLNPFLEVNGVVQDFVESAAQLIVEDGNFYGTGRDYPRGWEGKTVLVKHRWEIPS